MAVQIFGMPRPTPAFQSFGQGMEMLEKIRQMQLANQAQQMQNQIMPESLQANLQRKLLSNQSQRMENQYLPDTLKAKNALRQAQTQQSMAQTNAYPLLNKLRRARLENLLTPQPSSPMAKALQDLQQIETTSGPNSQAAQAQRGYIQKLQSTSRGFSVSSQPGGGFTITQGGLEPVAYNNQGQPLGSNSQPNALLGGDLGNVVPSPASPHSRYSTGGMTLIDPTNGYAVSTPTRSTAGKLQQGIIADTVASPMIRKVYNDIAPLLGPGGRATQGAQWGERLLGMNTDKLDRYQSATQTEIPQNADQLLKSMGLNATEGNRRALQGSMTVNLLDTPHSYARRVADTLSGLMMRGKAYRQFLKKGISLQNYTEPDIAQALSDQIYRELIGKAAQPSSNAQSTNNDDPLGIR